MESWNHVIEQAEAHDHYVQFYKADEPLLNRNVGRYLWEGLLRGDALLIIATPQRQESLTAHLRRMGGDVTGALNEGQLTILDAQGTLDLFMVDGRPDRTRFEEIMNGSLRSAGPRSPGAKVRAYGEMVGLLWEAEMFDAAIQLEDYWNHMIHSKGLTLFCGYPIDVFGKDIASNHLQELIRAHTHLLPAGCEGHMDQAVDRAIEDVLGPQAETLRLDINAPRTVSMPGPEATIGWLRQNLPDEADEILSRARNYYQASTATAA